MVVVNVFAVAAMFLSSAGVSGGDKAGSELAGWQERANKLGGREAGFVVLRYY
jgi:hypothetical protein